MTADAEKKKKHAEAQRRYYLNHKSKLLRNNRIKRERMLTWLREQKGNPCTDCHKSYPYFVMDFDHRDRSEKVDNIHRVVRSLSWDKLKKEVAKCDLVCSNCHRFRTHERGDHLSL